jgi:two-component system phosphate regulon sensor histidine kinase PhoR
VKTSNPGKLSLILSAGFSVLSGLIFWIVASGDSIRWFVPVISIVLIFVLQFFIIRYVLQRFILEKIKLVYKTIRSQKLTKEEKLRDSPFGKGDIIESVNNEVATWAQARKQEIDDLKKQEKYRREFLANVSHELITPLFNIQGFSQTLLDGGLEDQAINRDYLQKVLKNTDRMITIVNDLEVISRLESGEAKPEISRFDIVDLTREVFELLEPRAKDHAIDLQFGNEHYSPHFVKADREKIRQVLINLVDNSIKYGTEPGRTKVSFYDMDENLLIEVSDNGIGIGEEHLPHLFDRFYRVDKHRSRSAGGSGLGLAIVKHIVEAHEQTINVRSTPGVGSTFSFTLLNTR